MRLLKGANMKIIIDLIPETEAEGEYRSAISYVTTQGSWILRYLERGHLLAPHLAKKPRLNYKNQLFDRLYSLYMAGNEIDKVKLLEKVPSIGDWIIHL